MAFPESKTLVFVERPTAYVRLIGRAAVEGVPDFKTLIYRLSQEDVHQFCLDLTECKLMDSTFAGTLAAMATEFGTNPENGRPTFTLVNPNPRIADFLDNLGVLHLLNIVEGDEIRPHVPAHEVAPSGASKAEIAKCCLDAHRFLRALNPANDARFSEVTRVLEQQTLAAP